MRRAALGVSAHLGWAAAAAVAVGKSGLRVLRTERLELVPETDREAREPYHVAGGFEGLARVPQPSDPGASLERGLARQRRRVRRALAALSSSLERDGYRLAFAGLLVSRGRRADSVDGALASHTQIHIEEGAAIRDSIRRALEALDVRVRELDQKALWPDGARELGHSEAALAQTLQSLRPDAGPWRVEERTAALAAWLSWTR